MMHGTRRFAHCLLMAMIAAAAATIAMPQEIERRERLNLGKDASPLRMEDAIEAFESVAYSVQLEPGQVLHVSLASSNVAHVFDIHTPDAPKPVFVGGDSGNNARLQAKIAGEYVIRTYLLRFAARDGQSARYTLEVKLAQ